MPLDRTPSWFRVQFGAAARAACGAAKAVDRTPITTIAATKPAITVLMRLMRSSRVSCHGCGAPEDPGRHDPPPRCRLVLGVDPAEEPVALVLRPRRSPSTAAPDLRRSASTNYPRPMRKFDRRSSRPHDLSMLQGGARRRTPGGGRTTSRSGLGRRRPPARPGRHPQGVRRRPVAQRRAAAFPRPPFAQRGLQRRDEPLVHHRDHSPCPTRRLAARRGGRLPARTSGSGLVHHHRHRRERPPPTMHGLDVGPIDRSCVVDMMPKLQLRLSRILDALGTAGPGVPIVGMNYYDPFLGLWGPASRAVARSRTPTCERGRCSTRARDRVRRRRGRVADVAATFRIDDFTTPSWSRAASVPVNVALTCRWTWFCSPKGRPSSTRTRPATGRSRARSTARSNACCRDGSGLEQLARELGVADVFAEVRERVLQRPCGRDRLAVPDVRPCRDPFRDGSKVSAVSISEDRGDLLRRPRRTFRRPRRPCGTRPGGLAGEAAYRSRARARPVCCRARGSRSRRAG